MDRYIGPPPSVRKDVVKHVCRFILSSNVAVRLVENEVLQQAFALLGMSLPSRKELGGSTPEAEFQSVKSRAKGQRMGWSFYAMQVVSSCCKLLPCHPSVSLHFELNNYDSGQKCQSDGVAGNKSFPTV
eukprot:360570-Chlamydomonas_euryale.AAC.2